MENRSSKDAMKWMVRNTNNPSPNQYNAATQSQKESFNMGKVPFGSFSAQQETNMSRKMTHVDDSYVTPGPGQYHGANQGGMNKKSPLRGSAAKGNFNQGDFDVEGSGVRNMSHFGNQAKPKILVRKNSGKMLGDGDQLSASVLSLKQRQQIRAAESQRSVDVNKLIHNASQGSLGIGQSPGGDHPFHKMLNDKSITNLQDANFQAAPSPFGQYRSEIDKHSVMYEPVQTSIVKQAIGNRSSKKILGSTLAHKTLLKSPSTSQGGMLSKQGSQVDLKASDLGTMGIPRDISQKQANQNYLFNPASNVSPGDYNPNHEFIMKSSKAVGIAGVPAKTRLQAEHAREQNIEGMLKEVRNNNKKAQTSRNNVETFNEREARKQSHTFVSASKRSDMAQQIQMSDPGTYDVEQAQIKLKDRKDFAQIMPKHVKPSGLRNTEGAFKNSNASLFHHSRADASPLSLQTSPISKMPMQRAPQTLTHAGYVSKFEGSKAPSAVMRQKGMGIVNDRDEMLMQQSELNKAAIKKRMCDADVPGPGSYETIVPKKNGARDFPTMQDSESRAMLGDMTEEMLAEMQGRKPAPGFNSGSPRFNQERSTHNRSKTMVFDPTKPVVELQQLEGPQQRIQREFAEQYGQNSHQKGSKKKLILGNAFKKQNPQANLEFGQSTHASTGGLQKSPSMAEMTNNAEYNIYNNQIRQDQVNYYKKELETYRKQEEHLISFNSSSPRFTQPTSHQVRLVPGKDSISGVNFRMRTDMVLGPGSYKTADEIEQPERERQLRRANISAVKAGFNSAINREQSNYIAKMIQQQQAGSLGPGNYDVFGGMQKKSHNMQLYEKNANQGSSIGAGSGSPRPKFAMGNQKLQKPPRPMPQSNQYVPRVQIP